MSNVSSYKAADFSFQAPGSKVSDIDPTKVGAKSILKNAGSLALSGSQFGPWGAAAGAAAGIAIGVKDWVMAGKAEDKENKQLAVANQQGTDNFNSTLGSNLDQRAAAENGDFFENSMGTLMSKEGGTIPGLGMEIFMAKLKETRKQERVSEMFRAGGAMNVIPKGVTHEEKNKLGDQGIPVVVKTKGGMKKIAEIERDEIIFAKGVTDELEEATKRYTKNPKDIDNLLALGKMIKEEILNNTVDHQGELLKG